MLSLVTAPADDSEAISLAQVKHQCHLTSTDSDYYIQEEVIPAVVDHAELATWRALLTQTWELTLDECPDCDVIEIPKPPLISVTFFKYINVDGTLTTWASSNYDVKAPAGPRSERGTLRLNYGISWPTARAQRDAVTIRFVCGYGTSPDDIPRKLRMAMLREAASLFEHREDVIADAGVSVAELPGSSELTYRSFKSRPRYGVTP